MHPLLKKPFKQTIKIVMKIRQQSSFAGKRRNFKEGATRITHADLQNMSVRKLIMIAD
jgi:hypothetical protein